MKTGDRVRKRGLGHLGTIRKMDVNVGNLSTMDFLKKAWVTVDWDDGPHRERPIGCGAMELEVVTAEAKR
jgi:hypothetical protein